MQILNFEFKPGLLGVVVTLIAVSVFSYLAVWQLGRSEERKQLRAEIMQRSSMQISEFVANGIDLNVDRYKRYSLQGVFAGRHQVLLDNVVRNGKPGYEVITPFILSDETVVLVNRGWVPAGYDRSVLPDVNVTSDLQQIVVMLDKPRSPPVVGAEPVESGNRWNYLDVAFYRETSGLKVPDYLFLLSAETGTGYQREWPEVADKSGMHIGYAIQWAVFALIALGTFIGVNVKRVKT